MGRFDSILKSFTISPSRDQRDTRSDGLAFSVDTRGCSFGAGAFTIRNKVTSKLEDDLSQVLL